MDPHDEGALVRRMLEGDERAFDAFFDAAFQRVYRFALRRVGDPDTAEDVAQATLIAAMRRLASWRQEASLFTWLCTICRHEIAAHFARLGRRQDLHVRDDDPDLRVTLETLVDDLHAPDREFERRQLAQLVKLTLDFLPHRYGDLLEWKYIEGLSVAEIAARLGSTPKAVESALTRARDAFRTGFANVARS
jgi:RNA polymerase sigma-70 factor (ECF subfamily)